MVMRWAGACWCGCLGEEPLHVLGLHGLHRQGVREEGGAVAVAVLGRWVGGLRGDGGEKKVEKVEELRRS